MSQPLHVLLIEDDPNDAALVVRVLSRAGYDVSAVRVETAEESRRVLAAGAIDVVVADYTLPEFTGVAALGILADLALDTPLVVVSGTIEVSLALDAMRAGAKDFVLKDDLERLPTVIARELEEAENRQRRRAAEHQRDDALRDLRRERDVLDAVMANSGASLAYLDRELRYVAVNEPYATALGVTPDEMIGRPMADFPSGGDLEAVADLMRKGEPVRVEAAPMRLPAWPRRGVTYWNWSVAPVAEGGEVNGYVMAAFDVTEEIRATRLAEALGEIGALLGVAVEPADVLERVVAVASEALLADAATLALRVEGGWQATQAYGLPAGEIGVFHPDEDSPTLSRVLRTRQPHLVTRVHGAEDVNVVEARRVGFEAYMSFPLILRNSVIGAITFFFRQERDEFTGQEVSFGRRVALSLSLAEEAARLARTERRALRLADALNAVNELLLSTLSGDEMLEKVVAEASVAAGADKSLLLEPRGDEWVMTQTNNLEAGLKGSRYPRSYATAVEKTARDRRPLLVEDTATHPLANSEFAQQHGMGSYILVPVLLDGDVVGVLNFAFERPMRFGAEDVRFAERMTTALSLALRNAARYAGEQERTRRLATLHELADLATSSLMPSEVAQSACAYAVENLGVRFAHVWLVEEGELFIYAGSGFPSDLYAALPRLPLDGPSPQATAARTGEVSHGSGPMPTVSAESIRAAWGERELPEVRSHVYVPLRSHSGIIGTMVFGWEEERRLDDDEVGFYASAANELAVAIENGLLYEREREAARLTAALTEIDHSIHSTLESDEMLRRVVVEAAEAIGCESSALDLREDGHWVVRYVHRFPEDAVGRRFGDAEVPFAALAAETERPVVIDDAFADPRVDAEIQLRYDVRSVMVVPLIVRGEVVAALFFNFHSKRHRFTRAQVDFAQRLSAALGLAIANARLYEAEHRIAETLQSALLALPEEIDGVVFAHAYHSASTAARVGGDFYDVFELEHGLLGITVGDVSGKGLEAAALTSLIKSTLRAQAVEKGRTPAQIVARANEVVLKQSATEQFVTIFFAILDRRDGRLVYCNAGHANVGIVRADGGVMRMGTNSPLAGAFRDVAFVQSESVLGVGDVLFLYTDGLTEARSGGELFGEERLFEALAKLPGQAPQDVVAAVLNEVLEFASGTLSDDLAIMALTRSAEGQAGPVQQKLTFDA